MVSSRRMWERSRSALYAKCRKRGDGPARRGPPPALSDAQLLAAIRSDLARSPFQGEGHRSTRGCGSYGVRVSRTRVLRVMRAQGLLSPHRGGRVTRKRTTGRLSLRRPTSCGDRRRAGVHRGGRWVWLDHWNAECVGWHVCKVGSRFAALDRSRKGSGDSTARSRRTWPAGWHGWTTAASICQTTSSTIPQLRREPETNGVVDGIALKEQAIYAVLSQFVAAVERYNRLAPREAGVSHAARSARGVQATSSRVAQTCVQETGCGTKPERRHSATHSLPW